MADRNEIIAFLDELLETAKYEDSSPVGLQVEGRADVRKIATGVSACCRLTTPLHGIPIIVISSKLILFFSLYYS